MDLLREEILKKRKSLAEESGGKKFFKRSEIEQKKIQKLREEERREHELKAQRRAASGGDGKLSGSAPGSSNASASASSKSSASDAAAIADSKSLTDENLILPRQEVIRRLRFLKQPMTLFGEDDQSRLDRLKYVLKEGLFEVDSDMTEGQTNDFLRDIAELKKRQKSGIMGDRKRKSRDERARDEGDRGETREDELSGGESSDVDADKDMKRLKANFEDLCDEDKILVFYKKLLIEWKQELDAMENTERRTAKGKQMVATFKQCARYLVPLFNLCRKKVKILAFDRYLGVNHCLARKLLGNLSLFMKLEIDYLSSS